ncbi:MAG: hypothetical protein V6Z78_04490 [Holosporaceae bacterium]
MRRFFLIVFSVSCLMVNLSFSEPGQPGDVSKALPRTFQTTHHGFYMGLQGLYSVLVCTKGSPKTVQDNSLFANPHGFSSGLLLGGGSVFSGFYVGSEVAYAFGNVCASKTLSGVTWQQGGQAVSGSVTTHMSLKHFVDFALHLGWTLGQGVLPYLSLGGRYLYCKQQMAFAPRGTTSHTDHKTKHTIAPRLGIGVRWKHIESAFFLGFESGVSSFKAETCAAKKRAHQYDVKFKLGYQF